MTHTHTAINHSAHLFLICRLHRGIPKFWDVRILSDANPTASPSDIYGLVLTVDRFSSYQAASDHMLKIVEQYMPWAWPWLNPAEDAHQARYQMRCDLEQSFKEGWA